MQEILTKTYTNFIVIHEQWRTAFKNYSIVIQYVLTMSYKIHLCVYMFEWYTYMRTQVEVRKSFKLISRLFLFVMFIMRAVISKSLIPMENWHRQRPDFVRMKDPDFARTGRTRSMGTISTITRAVVALGPRRGVLSGSRVNTFPTPTMSDACALNVWVALLPFLTGIRPSPYSFSLIHLLVLSVLLQRAHKSLPSYSLDTPLAFVPNTPFPSLFLSFSR